MTKLELMEKWKYIKKSSLKPEGILIELFASNGDKKYLYERDIDGQMQFIDQNYDENLVHLKCRDMQITKVMFCMDTPIIEVKKRKDEAIMKKAELMKRYEDAKKCGKELVSLFLVIHMPAGEQKTIMSPNIEEKLKYIDRVYNDDLAHCNLKDTYIEDVSFFFDEEPGMMFSEAYELMKEGAKVKLPSWGGYWYWDNDKKTIMIHTKDGEELDIRQTEHPEYTFDNICSGDWIIADKENCPELGGEAMFSFAEAIKYLKRGMKVARIGWNGKKQYIQLATGISYTFEGEVINCNHEAIGNKAIAFVGTSGVQMGWLASQADMLAEDWVFAEKLV